MTIQTGYAIANLTALKALTSSQRTDGYSRLVLSDSILKSAWYVYSSSSTATADGDLVVIPDDSTGRWLKTNPPNSDFASTVICTSGCTTAANGSGKALQFLAPGTYDLIIAPGFGISITSGSTSIELHKWSQAPNTGLTGRVWVGAVAHTGGKLSVTIDSTYQFISIFAKNPANSNRYDGTCFVANGNKLTLLGFS